MLQAGLTAGQILRHAALSHLALLLVLIPANVRALLHVRSTKTLKVVESCATHVSAASHRRKPTQRHRSYLSPLCCISDSFP